jgi:hypothetical protein
LPPHGIAELIRHFIQFGFVAFIGGFFPRIRLLL